MADESEPEAPRRPRRSLLRWVLSDQPKASERRQNVRYAWCLG